MSKKYQSINPATGKLIKDFSEHTEEQMNEILLKAQTAFEGWKITSITERSRYMGRAADILDQKKEEFGKLVTLEMGKPLKQAIAEVEKCAWVCRFYAEKAETYLAPQQMESGASQSYIEYDPLGVIYSVMPWNFPFWQLFRFAAPSVMAGNVSIMKHAENVPQCALAIESVFRDAGFPEGVLQNVFINHDLSDKLISSPIIAGVTLTGSERAGRAIAKKAGESLKKTVLELGGSDPFIVLADADIERAVNTGITSRTQNAGQSCIAAKRFILHEVIADEFLQKFKQKMSEVKLGDPLDPETQMGPLARKDLRDDLHEQVKKSIDMGANLHFGGKPADLDGFFYEPTILLNPEVGSPAYSEELFGPVAIAFIVGSEEDAIRIANDHRYGLGASIWTADIEKARNLAPQIQSGNVFINDMVKSDPRLPFGGVKDSGYGRELSHLGMHEFVNIKTVYIA